MVIRRITVEEFDRLTAQDDRLLEFVGGEVIEVVSNNYASEIAIRIAVFIGVYLLQHKIGRLTGADGGYRVMDERYIPDVAFISNEKQPNPSHDAYNPNAPDLAVEVLSPSNDPGTMRIKVVNYLRAGTVVWLVNPDKQQVEVYTPDDSPVTLGIDDTLDGGAVLPGFSLSVADIFSE